MIRCVRRLIDVVWQRTSTALKGPGWRPWHRYRDGDELNPMLSPHRPRGRWWLFGGYGRWRGVA